MNGPFRVRKFGDGFPGLYVGRAEDNGVEDRIAEALAEFDAAMGLRTRMNRKQAIATANLLNALWFTLVDELDGELDMAVNLIRLRKK